MKGRRTDSAFPSHHDSNFFVLVNLEKTDFLSVFIGGVPKGSRKIVFG